MTIRKKFILSLVPAAALVTGLASAPTAAAQPVELPAPLPVVQAVPTADDMLRNAQSVADDVNRAAQDLLDQATRDFNNQLAANQQLVDDFLNQQPVTPFAAQGPVKGIPKTPVATKGIPKTTDADAPTKGIAKPDVAQQQTPQQPTDKATDAQVLGADQILGMPIRPRIDGPNHHWKTDPMSMLLAGHFGPVLHRIEGSYFNAPDVPHEAYVAEGNNRILMGPSTPLFIDDVVCTLAVAGYDAEGNKIGITAGHCGKPGSEVVSADSWPMGTAGYIVAQSARHDYSVIRFEDNVEVSRSYNGVTADSLGWNDNQTGQIVCKQGVATGWTCGPQFMADQRTSLAQYCSNTGDSGAPVMIGNKVIGLVSGGLAPNKSFGCVSPLQGPLHAPSITHSIDQITNDITARNGYGAGFVLPDEVGKNPRLVTPDNPGDQPPV